MKRILYLGIDPPTSCYSKFLYDKNKANLIHYPIIKTEPRGGLDDLLSRNFLTYTHIIFTSKTAVILFFNQLQNLSFLTDEIQNKTYIAIGKATGAVLKGFNIVKMEIAKEETQEGVIDLLKTSTLENSFIFWPHSTLSRKALSEFLIEKKLRYEEFNLYDTAENLVKPYPDLNTIDEIVFTSPSTVDAFLALFGRLPLNKTLTAIGPVTKIKLKCLE